MKRAYEGKFHSALLFANFEKVNSGYILYNKFYNKECEIDHVACRNKIIFIFEGKRTNIKGVEKQLIKIAGLILNQRELLEKNIIFGIFNSIRLFAYSWKWQTLVEYNLKGEIKQTLKYENNKQLIEFLRNL